MSSSYDKYFLYPLVLVLLIAFSWPGVYLLMDESEFMVTHNKPYAEKLLKPNIKIIDSFKVVNHRLPTAIEFDKISYQSLGMVEYVRNDTSVNAEMKELVKVTTWQSNYVLKIWRAEWEEDYISENHQYVSKNFSHVADFLATVCFTLGVIPLAMLIFYRRHKNKEANF